MSESTSDIRCTSDIRYKVKWKCKLQTGSHRKARIVINKFKKIKNITYL